MTLDSAALMSASGPLRAYGMAGYDKDREQAHATLSGLILDAEGQGDEEALDALRRARHFLQMGGSWANEADNLLDTLSRSRDV